MAATFNSQFSAVRKLLSVSLILLIASSVLGGPLGLISRGERHLLLLAIAAAAVWGIRYGGSFNSREFLRKHPIVLSPVIFFAFNLLWVFPFGGQSAEQLKLALMDMQALVFLPVTILVFLAMREYKLGFKQGARITLFLCALLALAQVGIWLLLRFDLGLCGVVYDYVGMFFGSRESVAILEQPSYQGSYIRVVWISSYWFLFAIFLAPLFIRGRVTLFVMQTIFGLAIIASYTRGIWLGFFVGILVLVSFMKVPANASWRPADLSSWRSSLLGWVLAVILVLLVDWMQATPNLLFARLYVEQPNAVKISDESANERMVQTQLLIEKWRERPLLGHGYGAYVKEHIRHHERPFLYEMVPYALLMKLGVLGFGIYLTFLLFVLYRLWKLAARFGSAVALLAGLIAYLIQVHTNPVFFSFTGMLIFSMLLYFWLLLEVRARQAPLNFHV